MLSKLRAKVESKNIALEKEMQEIQSILTPTQSGKFVLWVSDNPACMQMLDQLWGSIAGAKGADETETGEASNNRSNYYDKPKPHLDQMMIDGNINSGGDERGTKRGRESKSNSGNTISPEKGELQPLKKMKVTKGEKGTTGSSKSLPLELQGK